MRTNRGVLLIPVLGILLVGHIGEARSHDVAKALWVDDDFKDIPEPRERPGGYYATFFKSEFTGTWRRATDVPRLARWIAGSPLQAANVNAWDEVPDSGWFTNRHALRPMSAEQLASGPNRGDPPDFSDATITKAKQEGVSPGLQITDRNGQAYLVKFDSKDYPELQSGAEIISTKILFAAGYNVPENYIAVLDPDDLKIEPGILIGRGKAIHAFTRDDLSRLLDVAARRPDGRTYRVLASKILQGAPKGPFPWVGMRSDDPNDWIPHERRRELRGLRVIASWINHWDLKEGNTLDMYVDEGGQHFLRHYLLDFGATLGGGARPEEYFHGREYSFDQANIFKELFTLGIYETPSERTGVIPYPAVGLFSSVDFDPDSWKPSLHTAPFADMTREDAFWATRIVLSFSASDLRTIVGTAEYSDPRVPEYILSVLLQRQEIIARYWLRDVNPIAYFAVEVRSGVASLDFVDLMARHTGAGVAEYEYDLAGQGGACAPFYITRVTIRDSRIPLGPCFSGEIRIRIWTVRGEKTKPVTVSLEGRNGGSYGIVRITRS